LDRSGCFTSPWVIQSVHSNQPVKFEIYWYAQNGKAFETRKDDQLLIKSNQRIKFSLKIAQLIFFLFLTIHWINWSWYFITSENEEWFPSKDIDFQETSAFKDDDYTEYLLFYYYGVLTLVGNELMPTNYTEILFSWLAIFVTTIFIGIVVGEFTNLLSGITK